MDYVLPLALTRRTLTCCKHDGFNPASFPRENRSAKSTSLSEEWTAEPKAERPKAKNCALKIDS